MTRVGVDDPAALDLGGFAPSYLLLSLLLGAVWFATLTFFDTRDPKVIGVGYEEYRRIVDASIRLFGLIAIVAYLLRAEVARGFLLLALPAGLVMLLISRWMWRKYLHMQRSFDRWSDRVVVVGAADHVRPLTRVSGRSDLSWEDSVRLDLFYVENWSITEDLLILAKTLRAVVSSRGAY